MSDSELITWLQAGADEAIARVKAGDDYYAGMVDAFRETIEHMQTESDSPAPPIRVSCQPGEENLVTGGFAAELDPNPED